MRSISDLRVSFGGHGPAMAAPYLKIDEYINHRLEREAKILDAVRSGLTTEADIVSAVYTDISPKAYEMAQRAVIAHLEKLKVEGKI